MVRTNLGDKCAGFQPHVLQGTTHAFRFHGIGFGFRIRYPASYRQHHFRRSSPSDLRLNGSSIKMDLFVKHRTLITVKLLPGNDRLVPLLSLRRVGSPPEVFDGCVVHCHKTGTGTCLNSHITDGQATLHREALNRLTGKFNDITGTTGSAQGSDDRQHDIFGSDSHAKLPIDAHQHGFGFLLDQALGSQYMLNF